MKAALTAITVSLTLLAGIGRTEAVTVTLYDGNGLPVNENPAWIVPRAIRNLGGFPFTVAPSETTVSGGVQLNTAANSAEYSGYSNYDLSLGTFYNSSFPALNTSLGYSISFNVALNSSTNSNADRSAFSLTVTSSDGLSGIELGFEPDSIIGRNADFTPGETATFNTNAYTNYTLAVVGNNYTLSWGSGSLAGSLRSYNFDPQTSSPPLGSFNPYRVANYLFFGDNTGQESGAFTLGTVSVTTNTANAAVPFDFNPMVGLLILGAWTGFRHLKHQKK